MSRIILVDMDGVICNFIADILYGVLDPRIKVGTRR